ncbi:MAG TPA: HAMP domain-containing sensor histidine kinase [Candidatus Dormibacteraeota bacterium]|nr:HAMP domain-containing sensor histidine kinase [Candidatus Dormibacteraeota bacterium]
MPGQRAPAPDRGTASASANASQSLADSAERLAAAWPLELAAADETAPAVEPEEARRIVDALASALDDDLAPLISICGLDHVGVDPATMIERLDEGLRRVDAIRHAARDVLDDASVAAIDDGVVTVVRQLAVQATATLSFQAAASEERAKSGREGLAVTVHELRRPITVLSSYTQLLSAGALGDIPDRVDGAVKTMLAATEVLVRLVDGLSALGRLEEPAEPSHMADVALRQAVDGAVGVVEIEAGLREIAIDVGVDPELHMRMDRERLTLAITNLLSNAVKHSPDGGRVSVDAHLDGDSVVLRVRDHGPGFDAGAAERLFEKYYRDPGERQRGVPGTGLGLFIVRAVAERHGGTALARPAEGGGAEFDLVLPRR